MRHNAELQYTAEDYELATAAVTTQLTTNLVWVIVADTDTHVGKSPRQIPRVVGRNNGFVLLDGEYGRSISLNNLPDSTFQL